MAFAQYHTYILLTTARRQDSDCLRSQLHFEDIRIAWRDTRSHPR